MSGPHYQIPPLGIPNGDALDDLAATWGEAEIAPDVRARKRWLVANRKLQEAETALAFLERRELACAELAAALPPREAAHEGRVLAFRAEKAKHYGRVRSWRKYTGFALLVSLLFTGVGFVLFFSVGAIIAAKMH